MTATARLRVDQYALLTFAGELDPTLVLLFSETDRVKSGADDHEPCIFRATVSQVRDRLDVLGFTVASARATLQRWVRIQLDWCAKHGGLERELTNREYADCSLEEAGRKGFADRYAALEELTLETWLSGARGLVRYDIHRWEEREKAPSLDRMQTYMLSLGDESLGFAQCDKRLLLRAFLGAFADDAEVELDATEIFEEGLSPNFSVTHYYRSLLNRDFPTHRNVIILTEGSSDITILKTGLECVYPHLVDYFTFFDFHSTNAVGSAGALAATVKAFVAARIGDRFVAIFDNDSAGRDAMRGLLRLDLPANCQVIPYPTIELAQNYPTLGPSGPVVMDVNGLAGGVELYLGRDALTADDGGLVPVHWKGYVDGVNGYQGEILAKDKVRARFFEKVKAWKANPSAHPERDWSALKAIWDAIRTAFD